MSRNAVRISVLAGVFALLAAAPCLADEPPVRYMPQVTGHIDDFELGPNGDTVVTFSGQGSTGVWTRGQLRHSLPGHVATLSRDGRWIATGTSHKSLSGKVRVFSADDGHLRYEWDSGPIKVLALSSNGRYLAAGGMDGRVQVWDLTSGDLLHHWELKDRWVTSIDFSSDHGALAASSVREIRVWDLDSGKRRFVMPREQWVDNCLFSPDGSWMLTTSHDGTAHRYDSADGETLDVLQHGERIDWAAITADGRKIVTAGTGTVQVWDVKSGERDHLIEVKRVSDLAVAPDSKTVVAGTHGSSAYAFDLRSGERTASFHSRPFASRVAFSPDGRTLGVGRAGYNLYDAATGSEILGVQPSRFPITDLEFSPDGRFLLGSYWSRGVAVWDLTGVKVPFRTDGKMGGFTGSESVFLAGGDCCGGRLRLWDAASRRLVAELEHPLPIVSADAAPDGSIVATASESGQARVWSGSTGQMLLELSTPKSRPWSLSVPAPGVVAAGYDDGSVRIWKDGRAEPWNTFHHEIREPVRTLRSSADGRLLASAASNERMLVVWNLDDGPHRTLPGPSGAALNDLEFSADGGELLAAWSQPDLISWSLDRGNQRVLDGGPGDASCLAVSASGRWLAGGFQSGEVRVWRTGDPDSRVLEGLSPPVSGVAVDPGERWLAGAGNDGIVILWDLATGREIVRLATLALGGWAVITPDGRWDAADQGRVAGLVAWDRGFASSLANVSRYRVPGLLQEVMAPWRGATAQDVAASQAAVCNVNYFCA